MDKLFKSIKSVGKKPKSKDSKNPPPSPPIETKTSKDKSKSKESPKQETKNEHKKAEAKHAPTTTAAQHASNTTTAPKNKDQPKEGTESVSDDKNELVEDLCSASSTKVSAADFELLKVIGKGSFGKVMQVRHIKTGDIYAMKIMKKDHIVAKHQVNHTKDERHILQKISHPFIVKLNYAFQSKDKLYMIMDFVNGGELFTHLKRCGRFSEERARFYCAELCLALMHLHKMGIVYRDLKPENILLASNGHVVITDFGLSKHIGTGETRTFCGTPEYIAPEVLLGQGQSYPVDWWSLGTLTYEMMAGLPPFYSEAQAEMYDMIVNGELAFPESMSDDACDFLAGLLEKDPEQRLLPDEIKSHPWFEGLDWDSLEKKQIEPLWKPAVKDNFDYTHFDEDVITESAKDSLPSNNAKNPLQGLDAKDDDIFDGFTYERKENTLGNVNLDESE